MKMSLGNNFMGVDAQFRSPFEEPNALTDITFVVEERELHFCKSFLKATSPVFDRMFSSDFKEKEGRGVPLPDKTLKAMDVFLRQLHPAHCWKQITDDQLDTLLSLADEYQVDHIRSKCQVYIDTQLTVNAKPQAKEAATCNATILPPAHFRPAAAYSSSYVPTTSDHNAVPQFSCTLLSVDRVLLYLAVCVKYGLTDDLRHRLVDSVSGTQVKTLQESPHYRLLSAETQRDVFKARCVWLESGGGRPVLASSGFRVLCPSPDHIYPIYNPPSP